VDEWLAEARDKLAAAARIGCEELELDAETEKTLLDLARIAAHDSGARTNAPLLCYLVGRSGLAPADVSKLLHRPTN